MQKSLGLLTIFQTRGEKMGEKNYKDMLQNLALVSQIGISVVTPILLGVFAGQFVDRKLNTNYVFSIIFIVLGAAAGFLNILKFGTRPKNKGKKDE